MLPKTPITKINLYDAEFDYSSPVTPTKFYAVATFARTGSNYLCEELWRTGQLGAPYEYFNYHNLMLKMIKRLGVESMQDYAQRLFEIRTSPNGVFGVKLFPEHIKFMHLAHLMWRFQNLKFIYLERKNVLAQAISYTKAVQTSQWSNYDIAQSEASYDYNSLLTCLGRIEQARKFWENYFRENKIQPYRLTYEQFISSPDYFIKDILRQFGFEHDPAATVDVPAFKKQEHKNSSDWNERFYNDLKKYNPNIFNKYSKNAP